MWADMKRSGVFILVLALASLAMYARNLDDYFIGDDFDLIHSTYGQDAAYFARLLIDDEAGDVWDYLCYAPDSGCPDPERHGFLRPLKIWILKLDFILWGTHPVGYHVTSSAMFVAHSVLLFLVLGRLLPGRPEFAFVGAALATAHPVFAEIVPSITYREEVLANALSLAMVFAFLRFRLDRAPAWPFHLTYALAILSKESAVASIGIVVGYDFLQAVRESPRLPALLRRARSYWPTAAILAAYFSMRFVAFGGLVGGHGEGDFLNAQLAWDFHTTFVEYLFSPLTLSFHDLPGIRWIVAGLLLAAATILVALRRNVSADTGILLLFAGPAWYGASTLVAQGIYFAPRHTVAAITGMCVFVGILCAALAEAFELKRRWALALPVTLLFLAAYVPPALQMSRGFELASQTVSWIRSEIERQTADLPDGARILLVGMPPQRSTAPPLFVQGLQSSLSLPFTKTDIAQRAALDVAPPTFDPRRSDLGHYDRVVTIARRPVKAAR